MINVVNLFKSRNLQYLSICRSVVVLLIVLLIGCAMDGVRQVSVVDEQNNSISSILVLHVYSRSCGVGLGPDGTGLRTQGHLTVAKPFTFSSGEDLMKKKRISRGIILPPFVSVGCSNYVENWLFTKKGFTPKLVPQSEIYSGTPIVMTRSNGNEHNDLVKMLLMTEHKQQELKRIFGIYPTKEDITIVFDKEDIAVLRKNMNEDSGVGP